MNENLITELYNRALNKGYTKSREEFVALLGSDDEVYLDMFGYARSKGLVQSPAEFGTLVGGVPSKKKELPRAAVLSQELEKQPKQSVQPQAPVTELSSEDILSGYQGSNKPLVLQQRAAAVSTAVPKAIIPPKEIAEAEAKKPKVPTTDEDYFTGTFGNVLRGFDSVVPLGFGEFVDDMSRAIASGYRQGNLDEASNNLILSGKRASIDEIQDFIEKRKSAQELPASAEFQNYQRIYNEEGKSFWGVVKGLWEYPNVIPEVLFSSVTRMATNADALKAGAAAIGTGTAYGAATGAAAGGVGAAPGAVAGAIASVPYAFGLASSVVEMGSTFGELLDEELDGKEMTKENVKAVLEDPEKYTSIRNKAIARGLIIGAVDTYTGKLASSVGAKVLSRSAAKSATGAATRGAVTKSVAAGAGIEALGGSAGEAAARAAIGQEMDISEIALEGISELPGGIRSTVQARFAKPVYNVNGQKVSAEDVDELINTMTPKQLAQTKFDIKNDYEGRKFKIQDKIVTGSIKEQVRQGNPDLNEASLDAITEIEKELKKLEGNTTQTGKDKAAALRAQIKDIQENPIQEEAAAEVATAEQTAKAAEEVATRISEVESRIAQPELPAEEKTKLEEELQTLKTQQDAIQKQTADEGVLRSQRPQLGLQEMGEGDKGSQVPTTGTQAQVAAPLTEEENIVFTGKGGNKIVDESGEPITLLHGTNNDKIKFEEGTVFYATDDKQFAGVYGENLLPVKISLKNPYDLTDSTDGIIKDSNGEPMLDKEGFPYSINYIDESVVKDLKSRGFDGVRMGNQSVVAFDKSQVKEITPQAPVVKAQVQMVQFPAATTTLETEGTGVVTQGTEPVFKGSNAPTVNLSTDKQERYAEDYTAEEIESSEHAPSSRVVTVASNLGTGQVSYTKKGEKRTFSLPFVNQKITNKLNKLREKYKAIKGTSKEAKAEKAKISAEINKTAKQQLAEFKNMMVQNLLALYDSLTPEFIAKSKQWYVGANRMAQALAQKYKLSIDQVGGIIAALSPQNDWFNNVSVAERTIEVMTKYGDTKLTKDIVDKAVAYNTDANGEPNSFAKDLMDLFNQYGEVSINELQNQGLSIDTQAAMLRAFDQAVHSPKVAMTDPEGKFTGFDTTPVRWNSNTEIGKAISIFRDGSIENINSELGGGNKVRNFYNNIVDPDSQTPYVTADTHALSAALNSPISANDAGGVGLFNGGAEPLYALVKSAYIDAARIAGIKPREMQSITWEAQRIGINDKNRTPEQKQKTFDYITETRTNNQTPYERATELIARNRSANPSWGKSTGIETQKSSDAIREGARLRAEQRTREISALRGPAGERVGAAPTAVGGAVTGGPGTTEGVKARVEYGTPVTNEQGINDIEAAVAQDARKKSVIDAVRIVTKLFKSLFPNGEIYVFDNQEDYNRHTKALTKGRGGDSVGLFSYSKNPDGSLNVRIDIDLTRANATTVYHEIAHAVMLKTFGDNKAKFRQFRDQLTTVLKGSTVKKLDSFAELYAENEQPEEWLVELAAAMADQDKSIKIDTITKIAAIVNKFVSELTNGLIKPFSETASKKEVIDFFNQMAVSIKTGQEIITTEKAAPITAATKQARRVEQGPEGLPGYEKLIDDVVNTLIPNALKRRLSGQELIDLVKRFVSKSDVYKKADDIQKDAIVRAVNGLIGESYKEPPSINRILGRLKDITKVTITEKQALNNQIKLLARGAKDATKAWTQASKELATAVQDLADTGRITAKQVAAVVSRFAKVNMFDDASIGRFVDYMSKVFANAEYAEQIATINKALPNAKKNIETKLGVSKNLIPVLRKLFAIKPTLIPDNLLSEYTALVSMMGERKSVLNLQESGEIMDTASKILSAVQEEQSLAYELADIYEQYPSKVLDEDGNVDYAETIKDMLSNNIITSADVEVMKKYKSIISPSIPAEPMTEQELADEKKALINLIQDADVDTTTLPSRDERDTATKLKRLLRSTDSLNALTNNELKNLLRVIDNINNGFLPNYAQLMIEKMDGAIPSDRVVQSIKKAKLLPLSKMYAKLKSLLIKGRKDAITLMFERNPIYYYDQLLGDFNTRAVYDAIFKPIADAYAAFKSSVISTQERLDNAFKAVEKSFKNNGDKVVMSKYKMTAYLLQLEYLSNPESNKVNPAIEFLDATIKKIRKGKTNYSERDAEMLQDIVDKYSTDGQIDANKLYNSFNEAEKKAIKTIQDINAEMTSKAEYIAGVLRGEKFTPINNYIHHDVMIESSPTEAMADADAISNFNSRMNPSTRAKSLMERTPGAKAIEFDILKSVNQAVSSQLMDYYLTAPIRTVRKTMNQIEKKLEEDKGVTSEQYKIFNAFNQALERAVETTLITSFKEGTLAEEIVDEISRQGYRAVLASVPRFISELISNVSAVLTAYSKQFGEGIKYFDVFASPDGVDIMKNVKSSATTRVYPAGSLSGQMVDPSILNQTSGIRGSRAKGYLANKVQQIYNNTLKKQKNFVELTADALISTPDKMVMRPTWFGSFALAFEEMTGSKPDFDKIAANDEQYMNENIAAIEFARDKADDASVKVGATDNPFMGILKGTATRNQSAWARAFNNFNNFMSRFLINEYVTARTGIYAAMGRGMISRAEGVKLLAAITLRMTVYSVLAPMLSNVLTKMVWGNDDEEPEDDKRLLQKIGQGLASTFTSLAFGRDFGNATKNIVNYGVEKVNAEYLDFLRNGEYDPYKDAIQYSMIPVDPKSAANTSAMDLVARMGGSMGPALRTGALLVEKGILKKGAPKEEEKEPETLKQLIKQQLGIKGKKEKFEETRGKELGVRIPFEVLGNLGYIPLYKDARNIMLKEVYKDLQKGKKSFGNKKELEKLLLQGYESKSDMRRYDPEMYEITFGEEGVFNLLNTGDYKDKLIDNVIDDIVRDIKDDLYQYTPKEKGGAFGGGDFGGDKFGGEKKKGESFGGGKFGE